MDIRRPQDLDPVNGAGEPPCPTSPHLGSAGVRGWNTSFRAAMVVDYGAFLTQC